MRNLILPIGILVDVIESGAVSSIHFENGTMIKTYTFNVNSSIFSLKTDIANRFIDCYLSNDHKQKVEFK